MLITYVDEASPGILRYRLDLSRLYPDVSSRKVFEQHWMEFVNCTADHDTLFIRDGDSITYCTEGFLPRSADSRTPVLLMLGNPASQSVRSGMCFAFERDARQEHRFWRALRKSGLLSFEDDALNTNNEDRNAKRRTQLLSGDFQSPFLVGIDVYFTFPSPASTPRWSGVAGLGVLFGRRAFRLIMEAERARLAGTIARYMPSGGAVITFQRDAYEGLRTSSGPPYSLAGAKSGTLSSHIGSSIQLFGAPPTRYAHSRIFQDVLRRYAEEIILGREQPGQ